MPTSSIKPIQTAQTQQSATQATLIWVEVVEKDTSPFFADIIVEDSDRKTDVLQIARNLYGGEAKVIDGQITIFRG